MLRADASVYPVRDRSLIAGGMLEGELDAPLRPDWGDDQEHRTRKTGFDPDSAVLFLFSLTHREGACYELLLSSWARFWSWALLSGCRRPPKLPVPLLPG